jgi:hypothetical protein
LSSTRQGGFIPQHFQLRVRIDVGNIGIGFVRSIDSKFSLDAAVPGKQGEFETTGRNAVLFSQCQLASP